MLKLVVILFALTAAGEKAARPCAGIMVSTEGRGVLAMDGPTLTPGMIITLVSIDNPQQVSFATITDRLADSEIMAKHDVAAPYYAITPKQASKVLPSIAVAILGRFDNEGRESAAILRRGKAVDPVRVRSCTSSEGLHFTLWVGEPLKGTRLWHGYYYLGYDVEPSCQPADYQDGG